MAGHQGELICSKIVIVRPMEHVRKAHCAAYDISGTLSSIAGPEALPVAAYFMRQGFGL